MLTAVSEPGWSFGSWTGCDASSGTSCTETMTSTKLVTAHFTQNGATETLTVSSTGSGTVTSNDGYINCGGSCTHIYANGTTVTLTAAPSSGWSFNTWEDLGLNPCNVTMTSSAAITAAFSQIPLNYLLTVSSSGSGTVSSGDGYINCGASCTHSYASGTSVMLNASPASGWVFNGWSGACSGTGSCLITMNAIDSVVAAFNQSATGTIYHILGQVLYNGTGYLRRFDGRERSDQRWYGDGLDW